MSNHLVRVSVPSTVYVQRTGNLMKVGTPEKGLVHTVNVVGDELVGWLADLSRSDNGNFAILQADPTTAVAYRVVAEELFVEYGQLAKVSVGAIFGLMVQQSPDRDVEGALCAFRPNATVQWNVFRTQIRSQVCGLWVWLGNYGWSVFVDLQLQGKKCMPGDRVFEAIA